VECFAALPRVTTMSQFKPVRNIALASSHDLQVALFATETPPIGPSGSQPKPPRRIPCLVPGWQTRAKSLPLWPRLRAAEACEIRSMSPVKQTAQVLHESLARILSVWFDRGYLSREILK
jgi:hypothetical protein